MMTCSVLMGGAFFLDGPPLPGIYSLGRWQQIHISKVFTHSAACPIKRKWKVEGGTRAYHLALFPWLSSKAPGCSLINSSQVNPVKYEEMFKQLLLEEFLLLNFQLSEPNNHCSTQMEISYSHMLTELCVHG